MFLVAHVISQTRYESSVGGKTDRAERCASFRRCAESKVIGKMGCRGCTAPVPEEKNSVAVCSRFQEQVYHPSYGLKIESLQY